jgi:hypothetical protein
VFAHSELVLSFDCVLNDLGAAFEGGHNNLLISC